MKYLFYFLFLVSTSFAATNFVDRFDDNITGYPAPNIDARTTNFFFAPNILGGSREVIVDYDEAHPYSIQRRVNRPLWPYYSLLIGGFEIKGDWEIKTGFFTYGGTSTLFNENGLSFSSGPSPGVPVRVDVLYNNNGAGLFYSPLSSGDQFLRFKISYDHLTNFWVYLQDIHGVRTTVNYFFGGQIYIDYQENIPLYDFLPVNLNLIDEVGFGFEDKVSVDGATGRFYFWGPELNYGDCTGKVKSLKMVWTGEDSYITICSRSSGGRGGVVEPIYDGAVTNKQEVFITGDSLQSFRFGGTLGVDVDLIVDGLFDSSIHTSCSEPIGYGSRLGPFFVTEAIDKVGNYLILPPPIVPQSINNGLRNKLLRGEK